MNAPSHRAPRLSSSCSAAQVAEYGLESIKANEFWGKSRVPKLHATAPLIDRPEWTKAHNHLFSIVDRKERRGFICALVGNRGSGKTQLGVEAIRMGCKALYSCRYTRAFDVFMEVRAAMKSDHATEVDAMREFIDPEMLVIDEMQERGETAFEDRILVNIIDKRYGQMNDTILIANQTPEHFTAALGPSVTDRIRETGGIIECTWESFRK